MLYHWWNQYWSRAVLVSTFLMVAWFLRQTQGAAIQELFFLATQPLRFNQSPPVERLSEARTLELQERLLELEAENQQLQLALGDVKAVGKDSLAAPIIGRAANQWWQQVLIGRGEKDGVKVGSPVQAAGGVVGYVIQVTAHTSKVLLISDPHSSVGAIVSRTRTPGYVRGKSTDELEMRFFQKDLQITPGDVVVTSAASTLFPKGLPIGIIQSVDQNASPVPVATVRLNAPISHLEWVTVTPSQAIQMEQPSPEAETSGAIAAPSSSGES
jgi:rod shape-determining protein MreC